MKPILSIQNLETFIQGKPILKKINLELYPGEILGVVGFSGSGKSTLAQSILKLIPGHLRPSYKGKIFFHENNLFESELRNYRGKKIGMVFQDPRSSLNPSMRIGKQVQEALECHFKLTKEDFNKRVGCLFKEMDLPLSTLELYPHQLSGGMNQRVLIAIARICEPEILIADEPTASLDPRLSFEILQLFRQSASKGVATILISHDIMQLIKLSDRLAIIEGGQIIEVGPTSQIYEKPTHPLTQELMQAVRDAVIF